MSNHGTAWNREAGNSAVNHIFFIFRFLSVYHKCSSVNPCRHGPVCEAVEGVYQCNYTSTDHYGPNCETGTKFWVTVIMLVD